MFSARLPVRYKGIRTEDVKFFLEKAAQHHAQEKEIMKLFEDYPLPWNIENLDPAWSGIGSYIIRASNNKIVIHGGTYSGDGDAECNFTFLQAQELVNTINATRNP